MARKSSILSFVIIMLLFIACCKKSFDDLHFEANKIEVKNTYNFRDIGESVTISQQGFRIKCHLSEETIELISELNELRASLDFCEDNFIGLNKDIENFYISCDKDIWNTLAGTPLDNNKIRIYENKFPEDSQNKRLTIQEWLNFINNEDQLITFEWFIEFNEPIISTEYLKFKLHFEIEDGSIYTTETPSVKFE